MKDETNKSGLDNSVITACSCSDRQAIGVTQRTESVPPGQNQNFQNPDESGY